MTLTTPHFPSDAITLSKMDPLHREHFDAWMKRLDEAHKAMGSPYGEGSLWRNTGAECWLDAFEDGLSPTEALKEDMSNADVE